MISFPLSWAACAALRMVSGCLDIIEAGTSFVLRYGMESVTRFKTAFPEKKIGGLHIHAAVDTDVIRAGAFAQADGAFHIAPYAQLLQAASMVKNCKIAVAGGISEDTIEDICRLGPDVVIVGP